MPFLLFYLLEMDNLDKCDSNHQSHFTTVCTSRNFGPHAAKSLIKWKGWLSAILSSDWIYWLNICSSCTWKLSDKRAVLTKLYGPRFWISVFGASTPLCLGEINFKLVPRVANKINWNVFWHRIFKHKLNLIKNGSAQWCVVNKWIWTECHENCKAVFVSTSITSVFMFYYYFLSKNI